jgi:SAM-dependent methyltransferase
MKQLTDVQYWDVTWQKRERPRRLWLYRDFDYETVRLLREAAGEAPARVLELGAGGSRVLPYLARKFGYKVFGADFSFPGCRLLQANLALQRRQGGVICEDLFRSSLPPDFFDMVYSSGVIEHFDDPHAVIVAHLRVLRPGGRLVLIVPNLQGFQGGIWRRLAPPLWQKHHVFGPGDLEGFLNASGLQSLRSGYLGSFFIHVGLSAEWTAMKSGPGWWQALVHYSVRLMNGLVSFFFRVSPLKPHSKALSPAFFALGTKPLG